MSDLKITKGNTFRTILEIKAYRYDGKETKDFDLSDCTDVTVKCRINGVIREITNFRPRGANELEIQWPSTSKPGAYTIEVSGRLRDHYWRYYSKNPIFTIVETTEEQNIPEDVILKKGTYYVEASKIYLIPIEGSEIKIDPYTYNWIVAGVDTGVSAKGPKGDKGEKGDEGDGVSDYNDLTNKPDLSLVALTGDYNDLFNRPTIPSVPNRLSQLINDAGFITTSNIVKNYYNKTEIDDIANGIQGQLAVIFAEDADALVTSGIYRVDNTEGPHLIIMIVGSNIGQSIIPIGGTKYRKYASQYDLTNLTKRTGYKLVSNPSFIGADDSTVYNWSEWTPISTEAVKTLPSSFYTDVQNNPTVDGLIEGGIYRMNNETTVISGDQLEGQCCDPYLIIVQTDDSRVENGYERNITQRMFLLGDLLDGIGDIVRTGTVLVQLDETGTVINTGEVQWDEWIDAQQPLYDIFQEILQSGVNIKTINGQSILGSGNITIEPSEETYIQEQSDWNQSDNSAVDYIKNKPVRLSQFTNDLTTFLEYRNWSEIDSLETPGIYIVQYNSLANLNSDGTEDSRRIIAVTVRNSYVYYSGDRADYTYITQVDYTDDRFRTKSIESTAVQTRVNSIVNLETGEETSETEYKYHGTWMSEQEYQTLSQQYSGWSEWYSKLEQADWNNNFDTSPAYIKNKPVLSTVATTGDYNDLQSKPVDVSYFNNDANYVTESTLSNYYTASYVDTLISNIQAGSAQLTNYYTKTEINDKFDGYYNKTEVDSKITTVNNRFDDYYTSEYIDTLISNIQAGNTDLTNYYTKTEVDNNISAVNNKFAQYYTSIVVDSKLNAKANLSDLKIDTTSTTALSPVANEVLGTKSGNSVVPVKLHKVSKTGDYNDLLNKPTIPAAQVQSDWSAVSGMGVIANKPVLNTISTTSLSASSNESIGSSIKLHKISKTGSWNDLVDKPTLSTVATTGNYGDLDNIPDFKYISVSNVTADNKTTLVPGNWLFDGSDHNYNNVMYIYPQGRIPLEYNIVVFNIVAATITIHVDIPGPNYRWDISLTQNGYYKIIILPGSAPVVYNFNTLIDTNAVVNSVIS